MTSHHVTNYDHTWTHMITNDHINLCTELCCVYVLYPRTVWKIKNAIWSLSACSTVPVLFYQTAAFVQSTCAREEAAQSVRHNGREYEPCFNCRICELLTIEEIHYWCPSKPHWMYLPWFHFHNTQGQLHSQGNKEKTFQAARFLGEVELGKWKTL